MSNTEEPPQGFFILDVTADRDPPITIIERGLLEYDDIPSNAVIFWAGNIATLKKDYRILWYTSGKDPEPIFGANSMLLNDFLVEKK